MVCLTGSLIRVRRVRLVAREVVLGMRVRRTDGLLYMYMYVCMYVCYDRM